jgi:hypothetical protein
MDIKEVVWYRFGIKYTKIFNYEAFQNAFKLEFFV